MPRAATTSDPFNAIAEPQRRAIVQLLAGGERSVGDIAKLLKLEQPQTSKHLAVLREVGLVGVRDAGKQRFYTLNSQALKPVYDWVSSFEHMWDERLDRLEEYLQQKETPMKPITLSATVQAPLHTAWDAYTNPEHIVEWNFASDDWHCPSATQDLRVGGKFSSRMVAKDGSFAFDFEGEYTNVEPQKRLAYRFGDRQAEVLFEAVTPTHTRVTVTFDPETQNPEEMQRSGWQAILGNYKKHAESL